MGRERGFMCQNKNKKKTHNFMFIFTLKIAKPGRRAPRWTPDPRAPRSHRGNLPTSEPITALTAPNYLHREQESLLDDPTQKITEPAEQDAGIFPRDPARASTKWRRRLLS